MNEIKAVLTYRQVLPVLALYVVISAVGLHYHELGLEEGQQFLFGRDSDSVFSLYHNMRYEGHPRLWCLLLYMITHYITASYIGLQVFHLLITSAIVFVFMRYAPLGRVIKTGIVFSYYFIFEYDIQSRSYSLGILFLFLTCLLLSHPGKYLPLIGCLLVLLCNTDLFYTFAAIGFFFYLVMEYAGQKRLFTRPFGLLTVLFLAGIACSLIQAQIPREDYILHTHPSEWLSGKNIHAGLLALIGGWFPVPQDRMHFWNTFRIDGPGIGNFVKVVLFLLLLLFPGAVLKDHRKALIFYYSSLFLLLAFLVVTGIGAARYFGMVFIYFLSACWIAGNGANPFFSFGSAGKASFLRIFSRSIFCFILVVQFGVGLYALEQDIRRPFSQSKNAIAYVKEQQLAGQAVVVDGYIAGPALCVYLEKKVWYLNTGGEGSFCYWRRPYFPIPPKTITEEMGQSPFLQKFDKFLLLSNREIDGKLVQEGTADFRFNPSRSFQGGILPAEDCYIYQVTRRTNRPGLLNL